MGLVQSFKYIIRSKYLWLMVVCSTAFYSSMNFVEMLWKAKTREMYTSVESYTHFNSMCIVWTGVVIMILSVFGKILMQRFGWKNMIMLSPIVMSVSGLLFFLTAIFQKTEGPEYFAISALHLSVVIGAIQNILAKGVKYSIWDTSREMLYIPLDHEMKTKGKAAADLVGAKLGKSCSSFLPVILLTCSNVASYISIAPVMMWFFIIVCILWFIGIHFLSKEYYIKLKA